MKTSMKHCVWVVAVAVGIGIGGQAVGSTTTTLQDRGPGYSNNRTDRPEAREAQPDYSKNRTYQQGMREGKGDHARNRDHSKKRHFKKDLDQRAYEAGYQQGRR